jgi:hypothetical protein
MMNRLGISDRQKDEWADSSNSSQNPNTCWYGKVYTHTHFKEHTRAYAIAALHLIGGNPTHEFLWRNRLLSSKDEMERWYGKIPWPII